MLVLRLKHVNEIFPPYGYFLWLPSGLSREIISHETRCFVIGNRSDNETKFRAVVEIFEAFAIFTQMVLIDPIETFDTVNRRAEMVRDPVNEHAGIICRRSKYGNSIAHEFFEHLQVGREIPVVE